LANNEEHAACQELTEGKQYEVTGHEHDRYQVKLHLKFDDQRVVSLPTNEAVSID
jgi:hypothetical protein